MGKAVNTYDSTQDTLLHITRVQTLLTEVRDNLQTRGLVHDASKLKEPEKSVFDSATPKLKTLKYGSDEYRGSLAEMQRALLHHYDVNSHHPEHYANGIGGMSLLDLIEMLCDWRAAVERHDPPTGILRSIAQNTARFKLSPQLAGVLINTVTELGW